ncbi:MAG: 16S rRNA (guanine(966)-N(2))-methyltransferase RsmD [Candidatus Omnitrophica bacterium]|nr:16S rRNA (guanine(966)-N(2))-methyltransferase RsmD [Candidatus Omnitrophota bacterium]MDD5355316.1 16S rRNA (guanine(966)-N(2))-methyltransferase RsmD [Candidatus Omnitrophota bacterium]
MRITTGIFRSRLIKYPKNIRPTQDKVRKSLLDVLSGVVGGSCFLELFAGSGAVGIEALSNGAKEVVFVDRDIKCCKIIENNLRDLGLTPKGENISVLAQDAFRAIEFLHKQARKFDIVFLDPPYYEDLAKKTLQKIAAYDILAPHALVIVEHNKKDVLEERFINITSFKQKRYGDALLSFYRKAESRNHVPESNISR